MIKKIINKFLIAPIDQESVNFKSYIKQIESGKLHNQMCFGVSEEKRGFLTLNPVEQPGALFTGGMGSGKSVAMRFSLVTRVCTNSLHDFYILVDPLKGMTDYTCLFPLRENVVTALNTPAKIIPVIDMLHAECMERKEAFSKVGANHIYKYEEIMRKKDPEFRLARIFLCIEEFHAIPNSEYMKYSFKSDQPGTAAYQFKELMRVGRSYGVSVLLGSQRATPDDIPSSLKPGLTQMMAFRVNNPGDAAAMNLPQAADIRSEMRGRCAYEGGWMQFPFLPEDTAVALIKKYYKPLRAKMLRYSVEDWHTALGGEGNEGMVKVKPYKDILANISQFNPFDVYIRFLEAFDFKVEKQTNSALAVQLIAERDGEKFAVLAVTNRDQTSDKYMEAFKNGAQLLNCDNSIFLNSEGSLGSSISKLSNFKQKLVADKEDLSRSAEVLDNRNRLEDEGNFEFLFDKLSLARKKEEIKEENNQDSEDDDDDDMPNFDSLKAKIRASMKS